MDEESTEMNDSDQLVTVHILSDSYVFRVNFYDMCIQNLFF